MPRLLDYLQVPYSWLAALDPSLPRALFIASIFASVLLWRKLSPQSWLAYSGLFGTLGVDASRFQQLALKAWQTLPSVALGGLLAVLGTGADAGATFRLMLLSLGAPLVHELASRYQGTLGGRARLTPEQVLRALGSTICLMLVGCARMADPCSEVSLATITAGCEQRIELECHGDPDCPVYLECSRARKTWQACP